MELRDNGTLIHDGIVVGNIVTQTGDGNPHPQIVLNLGWCRMAGVDVRVLGDPEVERRRVVLDRTA